jgi:hypothetical protein
MAGKRVAEVETIVKMGSVPRQENEDKRAKAHSEPKRIIVPSDGCVSVCGVYLGTTQAANIGSKGATDTNNRGVNNTHTHTHTPLSRRTRSATSRVIST